MLADPHCRHHHVRLQTAAKATAEQMLMHRYLVDREPGRLSCFRLNARHDLGSHPDVAAIRPDMHGAVQRLHGRMREKRHLIGRIELLANRHALCDIADRLRHHAPLGAGLA